MTDLTTLEELAPWPGMHGDVTAEGLARYYTVRAAHARARADLLPEGSDWILAQHVATDETVIALLLGALVRHAPAEADRIASLVRDLLEGGELGGVLADRLAAYGIPAAVIGRIAAGAVPAESEG